MVQNGTQRDSSANSSVSIHVQFSAQIPGSPAILRALKGHNKPAQGIALGFQGIALGFQGIALGFRGIALGFRRCIPKTRNVSDSIYY